MTTRVKHGNYTVTRCKCGRTTTARIRERTNPRDYSVEKLVLCDLCARNHGYGDPARQMIGRMINTWG